MKYFTTIVILFTIVFFTSLMNDGMPQQVPIAVVDMDQTSTTRALERRLSAFQSTEVVANYANIPDARAAMQEGAISGYIVFPHGFTEQLLSARQPHLSFYYNSAIFTSGALVMKDLKTISLVSNAAVGQATLRTKGLTEGQIMAVLQPIKVDPHMTGNPWVNYNIYITTMIVPGIIFMIVCLLLCYYLPKTGRALQHALYAGAGLFVFQLYVYGVLKLPHEGSWTTIMLLSLLFVAAAIGFAFMAFAVAPSRRMSMSVCSLWSVLNFSMSGAAYPIDSMHPLLQGASYLFPLRHYFMAYQLNVLHGYPLADSWLWVSGLIVCAALPLLLLGRLRRLLRNFVYTE
ncbi:MAG: ABC transporter permease [Bacteroidaceae bacterium]|nr:ABC transporter permease [Bacteroidaceae bacterium]